jgi:hypothetical protein
MLAGGHIQSQRGLSPFLFLLLRVSFAQLPAFEKCTSPKPQKPPSLPFNKNASKTIFHQAGFSSCTFVRLSVKIPEKQVLKFVTPISLLYQHCLKKGAHGNKSNHPHIIAETIIDFN